MVFYSFSKSNQLRERAKHAGASTRKEKGECQLLLWVTVNYYFGTKVCGIHNF